MTLSESTRRVTAAEVAKLAGCSVAAISLWVNGKGAGRLTSATSARIEQAVRRLNYVPNRSAQGLSTGTSRSVAFVFPDAFYCCFGHIVDGTGRTLGPDWELSFYDVRSSFSDYAPAIVLQRALSANPAALLIASPSQELLDAANRVPVPTVIVDAPDAPPHMSLVTFDMEASVVAMVDDLVAAGHRKVGYVNFTGTSIALADRRQQVAGKLNESGLELVADEIRLGTLSVHESTAAFLRMWPTWERAGITAVVCADDRHAYGVMIGCRELGLSIPGDLALIGFNDIEPAALLEPSLSGIRLMMDQIGSVAGDILESHHRTGEPRRASVPTAYMRRGSTAVVAGGPAFATETPVGRCRA